MIAPVGLGGGVSALYAGMSRGVGEVPAVNPVQRRATEASDNEKAMEADSVATPVPVAKEEGKGLLVDLYA